MLLENIFSDEYTQLMFNAFKMISDSCHQQDKKLQSALSSLDVHPSQYTSLFIICTNEGLNLRELAEKMHVENSTASVTVRRMEKSGLIKRQADAEDNRMVRLFVTELGWQQFAKAKEIVSRMCFTASASSVRRSLHHHPAAANFRARGVRRKASGPFA